MAERLTDTIAGLVFVTLGRVPDEGDRIVVDGASVEVLHVENTRIQRLRVTRTPDESAPDGESDAQA